MRQLLTASISIAAALSVGAALAYPDGAPWGAADPDAEENCGTCHFGAEPVFDSEAISVNGLPDRPEPGVSYRLEVVFEDPAMVVAGFQMFVGGQQDRLGSLTSPIDGVEFAGPAIRSTAPVRADGRVSWPAEWKMPDDRLSPVILYIAATAANDDGSPLGDTVHFRKIGIISE